MTIGPGLRRLAAGAATLLLAGSAMAKPISDADYRAGVQTEVDFQNLTCSDIDYLWHVFDDLTGRCEPVPPPPPYPPASYGTYQPPRFCSGGELKPTYRLSPELYATLGPTQRAYLAQAGIPWDVDAEEAELRGRPRSSTQFFVPAPINALARELQVAARLKNCRL